MRRLLLLLAACVRHGAGFVPSQLPSHSARPAAAAASGLRMMPLGIPKVPYRMPGSQQADWVDIYNRLYRERIIFLGETIDDRIVNQIIAVMLFADSEDDKKPRTEEANPNPSPSPSPNPNQDDKKPQYLYINTPGGSVTAGLALYDTMGHVSSEVITCNVGMAASMGSFILGAGQQGKRIALPHSKTMIHQPMGGARGQAEDIRVQAEQIMKIKASLVNEYAMMTGQTRERIEADLDRDNYMTAAQAKAYGLIDQVVDRIGVKGADSEFS